VRWAREAGAARVVAAVPVAAAQSAAIVRKEADELVCLHELDRFWSVGSWYEHFDQVEDEEVIRLLAASHGNRQDSTRGEDRGGRGVAAG
jgi:predicted phosphoribosyltransferase